MKKITLFTFVAIFAMASIGCQTTSNTNANLRNVNANTAVVVNSNTMPITNTNTNISNSNRWNANMTREEYERNKAQYEADRDDSTVGQGANDSWLWFKTKAALATTDELRDSTINVDVVNDVITLRGTVASKAEVNKAVSVANGIEGKKSVVNQLRVQAGDSMTNQMTGGNTNTNTRTNANR